MKNKIRARFYMKRYIKSSYEYSDMTPRKLANYAEKLTDADELSKLAKHESPLVRFRVALNMYTPQSVLTDLLNDEDSSVRNGAASNENISEAEMQEVADTPTTTRNYKMKMGLIDNIGCPEYILEQLAEDRDVDVASYANRRLNENSGKSLWHRDDSGVLRVQDMNR